MFTKRLIFSTLKYKMNKMLYFLPKSISAGDRLAYSRMWIKCLQMNTDKKAGLKRPIFYQYIAIYKHNWSGILNCTKQPNFDQFGSWSLVSRCFIRGASMQSWLQNLHSNHLNIPFYKKYEFCFPGVLDWKPREQWNYEVIVIVIVIELVTMISHERPI